MQTVSKIKIGNPGNYPKLLKEFELFSDKNNITYMIQLTITYDTVVLDIENANISEELKQFVIVKLHEIFSKG